MRVIRLGDRTSHGGEVITAASDYVIMDKEVALEDDICTCPIPGHGSGGIIGGDRFWTFKGRAVALQGPSVTHCGAEIFSSCSKLDRTFEGEGMSGLAETGVEVASEAGIPKQREGYDQHFLLLNDQTGKPLEYVRYRIVLSNGDLYEGVSDGKGQTEMVYGDLPLQADIEVFV